MAERYPSSPEIQREGKKLSRKEKEDLKKKAKDLKREEKEILEKFKVGIRNIPLIEGSQPQYQPENVDVPMIEDSQHQYQPEEIANYQREAKKRSSRLCRNQRNGVLHRRYSKQK